MPLFCSSQPHRPPQVDPSKDQNRDRSTPQAEKAGAASEPNHPVLSGPVNGNNVKAAIENKVIVYGSGNYTDGDSTGSITMIYFLIDI